MAISLEHVTYIYEPDTPFSMKAIDDISLEIPEDQFIGIIGHTGSGKSTLIQHLNGLVRPACGKIYYDGTDIWSEGYPIRELRSRVGLVFQYPEHQLFEEIVFRDVCFGPKNQGLSEAETEARAKEALDMVGLGEEYYGLSPFELSGGQKRRAAIAGVLAMKPRYLVLDEPTAGLDPRGRDEILEQISLLRKKTGMTVVLVSHSMEDVARYADRLIVIDGGKIRFDSTPREVFCHYKELEQMGLAAPQVTYLAHALRKRGFSVPVDITTVEEAKEAILKVLAEGNKGEGEQPC